MYVPEAEEVADLLLGGLRGNVLNVDGSHCCGNAKVVEMSVCGGWVLRSGGWKAARGVDVVELMYWEWVKCWGAAGGQAHRRRESSRRYAQLTSRPVASFCVAVRVAKFRWPPRNG